MGLTFDTDVTLNASKVLKTNTINIPTTSGGTTYGPGTNGYIIKSNGTTVYWAADNNSNTHRPINVNGTQTLGNNETALNLKNGSNVSITASGGDVTIAATDTTYESKAAASGGTAVSLVTTGEKYTWNSKTSNTGTVTSITLKAGAGIALDTDNTAITTSGTRTISISGVNTSSGSETTCLTAKGTWKTFGTSNLAIGTTSSTAMAGNTTVTNVAISANTTTSAYYPVVFATSNKDTTAAKNEGLQKSGAKFYFNPNTGDLTATKFGGLTLSPQTTGFKISGGTTSKTLTVGADYTLGAACAKGVTDNSSSTAVTSSDTNLITGRTLYYAGYTKNAGTITGITMNGASKGTSGVVDLGTVYNSFYINSGSTVSSTCVSSVGYNSSQTNQIAVVTTPKYITVNITAAAGSWTSATPPTQSITATGARADNLVMVSPASHITAEQLDALSSAKIVCTAQATDSVTLTCYGTEPSVNVPLLVTIF